MQTRVSKVKKNLKLLIPGNGFDISSLVSLQSIDDSIDSCTFQECAISIYVQIQRCFSHSGDMLALRTEAGFCLQCFPLMPSEIKTLCNVKYIPYK